MGVIFQDDTKGIFLCFIPVTWLYVAVGTGLSILMDIVSSMLTSECSDPTSVEKKLEFDYSGFYQGYRIFSNLFFTD